MRFYTYPPNGIEWPYLLVNPRNKSLLERVCFEHAILDSGVLIFHDRNVKEYPESFLESWKVEAKSVSDRFGEKVWVTIPDYPDDYNPGQFGDNVSKTIDNIENFISMDGVKWIISLQSRFLNPFSFAESIQQVNERFGQYPRIAIGTVCKTNKLNFIKQSCYYARKHFPKSQIHAFGLTLKAITPVQDIIDSFDSMAWTINRLPTGAWSCKNKVERIQNFNDYINIIKNRISQGSVGK